jgi:hypothetical protein
LALSDTARPAPRPSSNDPCLTTGLRIDSCDAA